MGSQHSATGTIIEPISEVLPQDLVCRIFACLHDPLTRFQAQLVCKAWRTALASSLRDVRICVGGAACKRQLEWLLAQGGENAQQLQALEVRGLLPKEKWDLANPSSNSLTRVLERFMGLRRLVLLPGCNLNIYSIKDVLRPENMPDLIDLQMVYHTGVAAELRQPCTLAEFAMLKTLRRLVLHLAGPSEILVLSPEWSSLTKLTELSLTGMYAMRKGTGVLEILMERLEMLTLKANYDIWLPLHAPQLRYASLNCERRDSLSSSRILEEHGSVWLLWPKLQELVLGSSLVFAGTDFCVSQYTLEDRAKLANSMQSLRALNLPFYAAPLSTASIDCFFQELTSLYITNYNALAIREYAEFSALHGLRDLRYSIPYGTFGLSEQLSALSLLSRLIISHERQHIRSTAACVPALVGNLPAFPSLESLVLDGVQSCTPLSSASLRNFVVRWTGEGSSNLPKLDGPCCGKLSSLELVGSQPHVDAKYLWSLPHLKRFKIVFASPGEIKNCENGVYDLLQALLSVPALKEVHINALALGPTILPPLQLFELLDHLTIACNCMGFGEQMEHSLVGYAEASSASVQKAAVDLSLWVTILTPPGEGQYLLGSQHVCGDRWEGPPSAHLFLMTPKRVGEPMWRGLRRFAPLICHEAGDYHSDFKKNLMYEWKYGPPHPLDGDHHTMAMSMEDHVVGLAAKYGISVYGMES